MYGIAGSPHAAAEGQPARAVFIDAHARIKGRRTVFQSLHILINQRLAERIAPRAEGIGGGDHAHAASVVGEIEIKMRLAVLLLAGDNGRCPGVLDPRGNLARFNPAVVDPVDHIVRGKDHKRPDLIVVVGCVLFGLLCVVRAVHIETALIFHGCGIGAEYNAGKGVGIALRLVYLLTACGNGAACGKTVDHLLLRLRTARRQKQCSTADECCGIP